MGMIHCAWGPFGSKQGAETFINTDAAKLKNGPANAAVVPLKDPDAEFRAVGL